MNIPAAFPPTTPGSLLEGLISAVAEIYARIDADQLLFLTEAAVRGAALDCPSGCGSCCEPFVPDILPAEAAFMAAWLFDNAPGLARETAAWTPENRPASPPCPFLRRLGEMARCAIYPVRPLVCRLFGAAGVRDRDGRVSFRPCAHMPLSDYPAVGRGRPSMAGTELERRFGREPPDMAAYASELAALSPSEVAQRSLIVDALPAALARVGLSLSLAAGSLDPTYSALS